MSKIIKYNEEAKKLLKTGIDKVADAVKITLGPMGKNVILENSFGLPTITSDGVSIAKLIELECPFENMGAELIKDVANKTNEIAGDGTTTSVVLTQSLVTEGLKSTVMGLNAMGVRKGMELASEGIVEALKGMSRPVTQDEIKYVATVSAGSEELGEIIAETITKVGKDGNVTIEESAKDKIEVSYTEGVEIDRGFISPYFMTNTDKSEAELTDAKVLVTNRIIDSAQDLIPLFDKNKTLVIIADDFSREVINFLVVNKVKGNIKCVAIKAPGFGDERGEILQDLSSVFGATMVDKDTDTVFSDEVLGKVDKAIIGKELSLFIGATGLVSQRITTLKNEMETKSSKYEKARIEKRINRINGKVAVIKVGASTESEMKYLKLRIEDAVNATKAALEEGIIIGGGSALAKINLENFADEISITTGYNIVKKALESPVRQMALNANIDGGVVLDLIRKSKPNMGYDFKNNVMVDMFKAGIIDPVKVTRTAIENSISTAAIFLTTDVAIATKYENKTKEN